MSEVRAGAGALAEAELDLHAAGFVVRVRGSWTDAALRRFRATLAREQLSPSAAEMAAALARAKGAYEAAPTRLDVCVGRPCRERRAHDLSPAALADAAGLLGAPIAETGCQGPCKQAPVVSLRVARASACFAPVVSPADWGTILGFARKARLAGSLLVDDHEAERFRFDPAHDHARPSAHLGPLAFLLGHFRGQGRYLLTGPYAFEKEVRGSLEAGGRFIALRMEAAYPLPDGQVDTHRALVIAGAPEGSDQISAHAFTDGGLVREYTVVRGEDGLEFDDLPPTHDRRWLRARKLLRPTPDGFEERLEVDTGEGGFVPYSVVEMRRVEPGAAA